MRSLLTIYTIGFVFATTSSTLADTSKYEATPYKERHVPNNQYDSGSTQSVYNGKITNKEKPRFLSSPNYELSAGIKGGYRTSELKWNIASDITGTATPNILSELKWEEIDGYQFQPNIEYTRKTGSLKGLNLQASVNKSITTSGKTQDSDYNGDNRTAEFSRSNNSSDAGHAEGFSASIGYAFDFNSNRGKTLARFTTLVGYAIQNQKFVARDGMQTIPATGSFPGLRSSYEIEWKAPFVGAELTSYFYDVHQLKILGRYSKGTYRGIGNWNLRTELAHPKSFDDRADASGFLLGAEYAWELYPHTQLTLSGNFNYFKTDDGTAGTNLADGTSTVQKFNKATWYSHDYMAGVNYKF